MNCPKCKNGELKENIGYSGILSVKKIITYYCPLCDFKNKIEFPSSIKEKMENRMI